MTTTTQNPAPAQCRPFAERGAAELLMAIAKHCRRQALTSPYPVLARAAARAYSDACLLRQDMPKTLLHNTFEGGGNWFAKTRFEAGGQ